MIKKIVNSSPTKRWLQMSAFFLALILLGHSVATFHPVSQGMGGDFVLGSMKNYHFQLTGFERSYWDFYFGGNLCLILFLALQVFLLGHLSLGTARISPDVSKIISGFLVINALFSGVCWFYYFAVPAICASLATGSLLFAFLSLRSSKA